MGRPVLFCELHEGTHGDQDAGDDEVDPEAAGVVVMEQDENGDGGDR